MAQPNCGRMSRSPFAVDSTITMDRSMSSAPDVIAIAPVWSTRIGNAMPRPMNVFASDERSTSEAMSVDLRQGALDRHDAGRLEVGHRALGLERPGRLDRDAGLRGELDVGALQLDVATGAGV